VNLHIVNTISPFYTQSFYLASEGIVVFSKGSKGHLQIDWEQFSSLYFFGIVELHRYP
jgi:hypothetical protein